MVARVASTSLVTNSPAVWRVQRSSSSCGVIAASPFLEMRRKRLVRIAPAQGLREAKGLRQAASGPQKIRLPVLNHPLDGLPIGQVLGEDAARQVGQLRVARKAQRDELADGELVQPRPQVRGQEPLE